MVCNSLYYSVGIFSQRGNEMKRSAGFTIFQAHYVHIIIITIDINTRLAKAWKAIHRLSVVWKSDLIDKIKRSFFQAVIVSILLYGYTTWMLTKRIEKQLDGNYTRMLRAILNKSWRQHPTKQQPYSHQPPIMKTIKVRWTRHADTAGEVGTSS